MGSLFFSVAREPYEMKIVGLKLKLTVMQYNIVGCFDVPSKKTLSVSFKILQMHVYNGNQFTLSLDLMLFQQPFFYAQNKQTLSVFLKMFFF